MSLNREFVAGAVPVSIAAAAVVAVAAVLRPSTHRRKGRINGWTFWNKYLQRATEDGICALMRGIRTSRGVDFNGPRIISAGMRVLFLTFDALISRMWTPCAPFSLIFSLFPPPPCVFPPLSIYIPLLLSYRHFHLIFFISGMNPLFLFFPDRMKVFQTRKF